MAATATKKIPENVQRILELGAKAEGNMIRLTCGQLDPATYKQVAKVLKTLGGTWKGGKTQAHVFESDAAEILASVHGGTVTSKKQLLGYFPTPDEIADKLVAMAEIEPTHTILEPSAGRGAIAKAIIRQTSAARLTCVEIDPLNVRVLRENAVGARIIEGDFLALTPSSQYDRIIANPPFAKYAEIEHVEQMYRFLRVRGRIVSVMSGAIGTRADKRYSTLRDFILERGTIEKLPERSFRESGTNAATCIVTIDRLDD